MSADTLDLLRAVNLFRGCWNHPGQLAVLAELMSQRSIQRSEVFIREGDPGDEMYILRSGEVEVFKTTVEQEEYTVARISTDGGAFFGELALIDRGARTSSIRALVPCEVLVLTRDAFERLGDEHPAIGLAVMRELAKILTARLRATTDDTVLLFEALVDEIRGKELAE